MKFQKIAAIGLTIIAPLSLSGCLILPGEFTSEMTVRKSGDFAFSYKGQIQLLGLASLMNNALEEESYTAEFVATCYKDGPDEKDDKTKTDEKAKAKAAGEKAATDAALKTVTGENKGSAASVSAEEDPELVAEEAATEAAADAAAAAVAADDWMLEERECTVEETAEQKKAWDAELAETKKRNEEEKKMFANLLGGIDPKKPETIARFTKELERMAGWNKVEHLGNGLFKVDYTTSGRLADDYAFPVIPRYALGEPMLHVTRWDNGRVRIEAPSFHNDPDFSMMAMLGAGSMLGMASTKKPADPIEIKGSFTITTDANIMANNTEEGPEDSAGGMKVMRWDIGPKTFGPPMALLGGIAK